MAKRKSKGLTFGKIFSIILIAFLFALLVGNIIAVFGSDYLVPGINLHLLTFASYIGILLIAAVVSYIVGGKK